MRILEEEQLDFKDVMILPKRSTLNSRNEVDLERTFKTKWSDELLMGFPLIAANMYATGTFAMGHALMDEYCFVALHKHYNVEDFNHNWFWRHPVNAFYTMGITDQDYQKFQEIKKASKCFDGIFSVCIDVANGYTERFISFVKKIREENPSIVVMAGNVVTAEMTEQLILSGTDIVKVGIGGGSVCETRKVTGIGRPQLSSVIECADAAHGLGGLICSDGGCREIGDIAKAFAGGADFVMLGGMLAGADECEGEWTYKNQIGHTSLDTFPKIDYSGGIKDSLKFFGMSSKEAMDQFSGGKADYRASEGKCTLVPYKGKVVDIIKEIKGGIRSCCTYIGAARLKDLPKCTTFVKVR